MRVIVGDGGRDVRWLPPMVDALEARTIVDALKRHLIVSTTREGVRSIYRQANEMSAPPQYKSRIADLLKRMPLSSRQSRPPVDLYVDECEGSNARGLLSAVQDERFERLSGQAAGSVLRGEHRDEVFDMHFRTYASVSSGIVLLDRYLIDNLRRVGAGGLTWLLNRFIGCGVQKFVIYSYFSDTKGLNQGLDSLRRQIVLPAKFQVEGTKVSLKFVCAPHSERKDEEVHERHLRFLVGEDLNRLTPSFDIGPGVMLFRQERLTQSIVLSEAPDTRASRQRERQIYEASQGTVIEIEVG